MNTSAFTKLLGWALVIFGIAGLFTGNTLIVFEVNTAQNIVHIATGIAALIAVSRGTTSLFLQIIGALYGCIAVVGLVNYGDVLGFFRVNTADNFLHIVVAIACLYFGLRKRE
tara:strand:- start:57 stop:395 length:339 start_codon:yes stop_codon:yes gene_type:complete